MSQITKTHFELTRFLRRECKLVAEKEFVNLDYDFDPSVRHYHKADRYREIRIVAHTRGYLTRLQERLEAYVAAQPRDTVRIFSRIDASARDKDEKMLSVSIWPR